MMKVARFCSQCNSETNMEAAYLVLVIAVCSAKKARRAGPPQVTTGIRGAKKPFIFLFLNFRYMSIILQKS